VPSSAAQRNIPPGLVRGASDSLRDVGEGAALLVDKPKGVPSFQVVKRIRARAAASKVGHAGTLDPMATGLLIILVARPATRLQEAFIHLGKAYRGTMRLGEVTPSYDAETEVTERTDVSGLSRSQIESVRDEYVGAFWQKPPLYSAVKVDGERLYEKARRGETTKRPPRRVRVATFDLLDWSPPDLEFWIECSKGTYIRALARDIGQELGVGAHLTGLRRHAIGEYAVDAAWALEPLLDALSNEPAQRS